MRIAIVHENLNQGGGAERVVEVLHAMYPTAPIHTTIVDRDRLWPRLRDADIRTSWMQRLPGVLRHFKAYLPLYPAAVAAIRLRGYDVVISSCSAFAKGVAVPPGTLHVCYCHTPARFLWNYDGYVGREQLGPLARVALPPVIAALRRLDLRAARRPDVFVANSSTVAARIERCYGRASEIVFPPVGVERYAPSSERGDYHLIVARLAPYKRIDLAVQAFNRMGRPLIVIGEGGDREALARLAGPTIRFLGRVPDAEVARYYARCRALIFPGEEDFGIAPLEANASGRPVVAFRAGGVLDTVVDGRTGVLFDEQTPEALAAAVERCESLSWDADVLRRHAESFAEPVFRARFAEVVERALSRTRGVRLPDPSAPAGVRAPGSASLRQGAAR